MGLQIRELLKSRETSFEELSGKTIAIDGNNLLYQFLTTIRQRDGSFFTDSKGRVTSHIMGLFTRTSNMLMHNIRPVFVFDGPPPALKNAEALRRREAKIEAIVGFEDAKQRNDIEEMRKYASRTTRLTSEMIDDAKRVISAFGCPIIDAPSEGEAEAAYIAKSKRAFAVVSQDFDSLLYGAPVLIRNFSVAGKRKVAGKPIYESVSPEMYFLSENLANLGIDSEQLICLGVLIGTDYNPGGVKGIGPRKALALVKKYGHDFEALFSNVEWKYEYSWRDVADVFHNMPTKDAVISFKDIDTKKLIEILCGEFEFSRERTLPILEQVSHKKQKGLNEFF
ncbi:MAG: flap endonuclease-1 [Candidatus Woesearchaeota archaeon]